MLNSRFSSKLTRVAKFFLTHTCVIINYAEIEGEEDEHGNPKYTPVETENVPCLFLWQETEVTSDAGTTIRKTPLLYLYDNQAVTESSLIRDVVDRTTLTTLLKKASIVNIDTTAEGGTAVVKVCTLDGAVV